ncbi:aminotransferase class IV [Malonomonas rubra]|uniref:aminotransferase class IV n=1 Tax=Malonomonas rubra TaxID=57040 RepID=UPI0026E97B69|nr:aminotransferase class IV [Malonomonas rubra]
MLVCLNGTFIPHEVAQLPITDGGFLFGDTLFETLKAFDQKILLVKEHLDRLQLSAELIDFPCDRKRIETSLHQMANSLSAPVSRVRLTLTRGTFQGLTFPTPETGSYLLTAIKMEEISEPEREIGAACVTAPNQRINPLSHLPQMKRGNYSDCLYAANYARTKGAHEALFVDPNGNLLEGSTSNLFALIDDKLLTPPLGQTVLAGVMRRQIIDAAAELGILVCEKEITKKELLEAEEAFLCNSLIDILPLASLDGKPLKRGCTWKTILKTLKMRIDT